MKKNCQLENSFLVEQRKGKIGDDGKISDGHISVKDYLICERIQDKFEMKNMGDCHDHYFRKDVLLLVDVFEKFIGMCLKFYEHDACHYFSSPGLSWDAMLKMTGAKLEKISDIDKYLFIEKGLRDGISYIAKRYAKANYCDSKKQSTFISYLGMNNLYGWAMSEYLPYERFQWLKNIDEFDVMSIKRKKSDRLFIRS